MTSLFETFAQVRIGLESQGLPKPGFSLFQRDQMCAAFRSDLLSQGLDVGREGSIEAAIAGLAIGVKIMVQTNVPLPFVNDYVSICECLLPMLEETDVDLSSFEDNPFPTWAEAFPTVPLEPVIRYACSRCGGPDAIVPAGNLHLCVECAGTIVQGGVIALRLSGNPDMPQVGGPEFNREEESVHAEESASPDAVLSADDAETANEGAAKPTGGSVDTPLSPSWKDMTVNDALRRLWRKK